MLAPPATVVARDLRHLNTLVTQAIESMGLAADLNHIDVSGVTGMDGLFSSTEFNGDISRWDVSNVTSMVEMFYGSPFNGDISKWNTSKVELMSNMFQKSAFTGDISDWNTGCVESFRSMFLAAKFAGDISKWTFKPLAPAQMSQMFSDTQVNNFQVPNMYCWVCAIAVPDEFSLRPEWQQHLDKMLAPLSSLGLPILDAATLVHQAWQERHLGHDSIALPALA